METNPAFYGLSAKIQLKELINNRLGIYKVIKSRIILKDATKIVAIAHQIKSRFPKLNIVLVSTRNICSKSIALLDKENIKIEYVEL